MNLDLDRVPASLDQALELLDRALSDREKGAWSNMTAAKMFDLQADLARILWREWSLNDGTTPLRIFFRELGLSDAKEISLLLIDAYWRKYNKKAIPVQELVLEYLEE